MKADLVQRLRDRAYSFKAPDPLVEQAADEIARLRLRVAELEEAIRRLAEQDATLSVCEGSVTVTMDATLTDAEREAVERCVFQQATPQRIAVTLRGLLERLKWPTTPNPAP